MITFTSNEKLALLLNVLGEEVVSSALQEMPQSRATELAKLVNEFRTDPPTSEEIEFVVDDFLKYFRFAVQTLGLDDQASAGDRQNSGGKKQVPANSPAAEVVYFPQIQLTDDPVADLNKLDPYQVFKALEKDHPKTIAMVLRKLEVKQAAKVMEQLVADVRATAVVFMTQDSTVPLPIVNQVLKTIAAKAQSFEYRVIESDVAQSIADLLRSLPKTLRVELTEELMSKNAELGEIVKSRLYVFKDILRLDDRNIQKLLSQIQTDWLISALQKCDETLSSKLLANLSKRARESVLEEMEYKQGISEEEIDAARAEIVGVLAKLDESGEIKMD